MFTLKSFYKSREWETFREIVISKRINNRGEIICGHCGKPIYKKYDCILHHKKELNELNVNDFNISLNEENIELLHFDCHNEIHNRFGYNKQEVYIVWGSPCSGKNTWVQSVAKKDDLVIDMDRIYNMINPINPKYIKPQTLSQVAFKVRESLLECVRDRIGKWHTAYIITTECLPTQLDRMSEVYGAKLIHIDTPKEQCLSNLYNDKERMLNVKEHEGFINKFFENLVK